jgi:hypothetical protein
MRKNQQRSIKNSAYLGDTPFSKGFLKSPFY